jgi:uncharacterized membrane protein YraQ (UPF0718 family)
VLGKAIGLHPAVSIIALLVGTEVLGVWGALFAAPVAGLIQVFLAALWLEWRQAHPTLYPEEFGVPLAPVTTAKAVAPGSANERKSAANDLSDTASAALV